MSMRPLIALRRLLAAIHGARAQSAYKRGQIEKALGHYARFAEWRSPRPHHEAFLATLLILDRRSDEARALFRKMVQEIEALSAPSENERYVLDYCRFYAALIDRTEAERFRLAAEGASPDPFLHQLLPLPAEGWDL